MRMLEMSPEPEVADLGLMTRFGSGVSALSVFEGGSAGGGRSVTREERASGSCS